MASAVHHCKDCGLYFESSKSLDVHLHYHKDNLLSKWASQAQQPSDAGEHNNNTCNTLNHNKGGRQQRAEHQHNVDTTSTDVTPLTRYSPPSGGSMKSTTASTNCLPPGRPPSSSSSFPQSSTPNGTSPLYAHSSPAENRFSPGFNYADANSSNGPSSAFSPVPSAGSPSMLPPPDMRSPGHSAAASNGYYAMDDQQQQAAGYAEAQYTNGGGPMRAVTPSGMQSPSSTSGSSQQQFRYHPYNGSMYPTQQTGPGQQQAASTYGQSQCDKCGCVCESPTALLDHMSVCHHHQQQQQQQNSPGGARNHSSARASPSTASAVVSSSTSQFLDAGVNFFEPSPPPATRIKTENEAAEILDLDSHKVHVYQPPLDNKGRLPPPFPTAAQQQQQHAC